MSKGFILKVLENVKNASENGVDMSDEIDAAKDMLQHGYDANDDQWKSLNRKTNDLEQKQPKGRQDQNDATRGNSGTSVVSGTKGHQTYVSGAEAGTEGNQIGWPGTDQDQDGPGKANRTVPGVKPPKDKSDKK